MLIKQQRGMSTLGMAFLLLVGVAVVYTAFKVVPVYVENRYISASLKSLGDAVDDWQSISKSDIRDRLFKFYNVNNIESKGSRNIDIERRSSRTLVTVAYEERVDFVHNIDLVFTFENQLDSSAPDQCCDVSVDVSDGEEDR